LSSYDGQELLKCRRWAVVGDVQNTRKWAAKIYEKLKSEGYSVIGVNPRSKDKGVPINLHQGIDEIGAIDVIDLVINPKIGLCILEEARELKIDKVLIQPGAESGEILEFCKLNGITAIESCVLVELSKRLEQPQDTKRP
jgi:predicted CoA-binding protein